MLNVHDDAQSDSSLIWPGERRSKRKRRPCVVVVIHSLSSISWHDSAPRSLFLGSMSNHLVVIVLHVIMRDVFSRRLPNSIMREHIRECLVEVASTVRLGDEISV